MKNSWIKNKTVIITGASGGLGFNIAKYLMENYGAKIIGICRNENKMKESLSSLKDSSNFLYEVFDINDKQKWLDFSIKLQKKNIIPDVFICNAGIMLPFKKFGDLEDDEINEIINTNFIANVFSTKIILPQLLKSPTPTIVNIVSSAGMCAVVGESMYSATKFAMRGFTDTIRSDYSGKLFVTGVYPGFIKTNILQRQKKGTTNNKYITSMMMPIDIAVKKICKGILKRKKSVVIGFDGKTMSFFYRLFPHFTVKMMRFVLKKSKQPIFFDIFN